MTTVCLVGNEDCDLRYELLSRETSREALSTYRLQRPFENSVAVETISLGSAVSLLNDLNWYLVRFAEAALVLEPSVSETEWLSRALAGAIREGSVVPEESGTYLKVYGLARAADAAGDDDESVGDGEGESVGRETDGGLLRPVEPMYVTRTGPTLPEYDLRDVEETLHVRVTEAEFGG
ncbi:DUF5804 family protein [Halomarina ordinaria]|uniref:DUF5804 family protein n=1 Tax=Halomarina ordinaria TaxID=3033939 RepID=A0ABD5UBR5_9EURY|nr:DUF5804 family protein [Halomarina sp. PSRA2]